MNSFSDGVNGMEIMRVYELLFIEAMHSVYISTAFHLHHNIRIYIYIHLWMKMLSLCHKNFTPDFACFSHLLIYKWNKNEKRWNWMDERKSNQGNEEIFYQTMELFCFVYF